MVEDEGQDIGVRQVIPGAPECSEPGCAGPTRGRGPWVLEQVTVVTEFWGYCREDWATPEDVSSLGSGWADWLLAAAGTLGPCEVSDTSHPLGVSGALTPGPLCDLCLVTRVTICPACLPPPLDHHPFLLPTGLPPH